MRRTPDRNYGLEAVVAKPYMRDTRKVQRDVRHLLARFGKTPYASGTTDRGGHVYPLTQHNPAQLRRIKEARAR